MFKTAEITSTALEAACLGVSIAELNFECGSVHQSKCSVHLANIESEIELLISGASITREEDESISQRIRLNV